MSTSVALDAFSKLSRVAVVTIASTGRAHTVLELNEFRVILGGFILSVGGVYLRHEYNRAVAAGQLTLTLEGLGT